MPFNAAFVFAVFVFVFVFVGIYIVVVVGQRQVAMIQRELAHNKRQTRQRSPRGVSFVVCSVYGIVSMDIVLGLVFLTGVLLWWSPPPLGPFCCGT